MKENTRLVYKQIYVYILLINIFIYGCLPERGSPRLLVLLPVCLFSFDHLVCFMIVCLFYVCVLFVWLVWLTITIFMLLRRLRCLTALLLLVFSTADSSSALQRVLLLSINSLDRKFARSRVFHLWISY